MADEQAQKGDNVSVHYTGRLDDGTVFDTSEEREPLRFTLGEGQVIPGFEQAIEGMKVGETRTTTIDSGDAYGPYREDLVLTVDRQQVPSGLSPQVGQQLELQGEDGGIPVVVSEVNDQSITLDANHPLAGMDLTFDIRLMKIDP